MNHKTLNCSWILILIGLLLPEILPAQTITASFDPTEAVLLPAAGGWREQSFVGFSYSEASGNRNVDSNELYKFDSSGITANFHFMVGNMAIDGGLEQISTQTTADQNSAMSQSRVNLDNNVARLNFALLGNDFVSVGLGGRSGSSRDVFDASSDEETTDQSSIMGSISVKTFDFLYLGGGYERVRQESSFQVENTFNVLTLGAATIFGDSGSTRLRLEYSYASSPYTESLGQGELVSAIHEETSETRYAAELIFNGLLFSVRGFEHKIYLDEPPLVNNVKFDEIIHTSSEAGVLWVPESGIVLGFYFASAKTSFVFEEEQTEFRINLAYIFQ